MGMVKQSNVLFVRGSRGSEIEILIYKTEIVATVLQFGKKTLIKVHTKQNLIAIFNVSHISVIRHLETLRWLDAFDLTEKSLVAAFLSAILQSYAGITNDEEGIVYNNVFQKLPCEKRNESSLITPKYGQYTKIWFSLFV